jgi:DNA replication protein DnaD
VITAMKRSLDRGFATWSYALGILADWESKGVQTMNDVQADDSGFRQRQAKKGKRGAERPAEVVPDWFREQEQRKLARAEGSGNTVSGKDADKERAELEAMLAQHRKRIG